MNTILIGHSIGWLLHTLKTVSFSEALEVLTDLAEDTFEAVWPITEGSDSKQSANFSHASLHLPGFFEEPTDDLLQELTSFCEKQNIGTAVSHPCDTSEQTYDKLKELGIPVIIENMDRKKDSGFDLTELHDLGKKHDLGFCLDLQHAYERSVDAGGNGVELGKEYADMMTADDRLKLLHVSGEIAKDSKQIHNHAPLHHATNASEILKMLHYVLSKTSVPIILEGSPFIEAAENLSDAEKVQHARDAMRDERGWLLTKLS